MKINHDRLIKLFGDETRARRFVALFESQLPEELARLERFLSEKNWADASIVAHGLKSQCRYMGLEEAGDLLEKMEMEPENESLAELKKMLNQ